MNEQASQHIPKPSAVSTGELIDSPKFQKNSLLESLDSPEMVKMREDLAEAHQKSIEASVGWYHMLSAEDKYRAVEAFCYIICKAEREGTSHRGLMSVLGVYPEAFWITELMDVHNALWTEYQERESKNWKPKENLNDAPHNSTFDSSLELSNSQDPIIANLSNLHHPSTAFEEFCSLNPDAKECRVFDC